MTYAARPSEFVLFAARAAPPIERSARNPRRGYVAIVRRGVRVAAEAGRARGRRLLFERTGGRFTDDIERRLVDRLVSGDWRR